MQRNRRALFYLSCAVVPMIVVGCGHAHDQTPVGNSSPQRTAALASTNTKAGSTNKTTQVSRSASSQSATSKTQPSSSRPAKSTGVSTKNGQSTFGGQTSPPATSANSTASPSHSTAPSSAITMHADGLQVTFHPTAWTGLGTAALIVSPPNQADYLTQLLYVITDGTGRSSSEKPTATLLSDHASAAKISPTGQYVAVLTASSAGGATSPVQDTLWLMAADGASKQKLSTNVYSLVGNWLPHSDTFLYADTKGNVYSVTPGLPPKKLSIALGKGQTVNAIQPNPQNSTIALDIVVPDGNGDPTKRHDKLVEWNPDNGQMKTLVTAKQSDGFDVGPWTNDGQKIFYWLVPEHSGSIAADGLSLYEVGSNVAKPVQVAETLTGKTVLPVGGEDAVIQTGHSRFLYDKKTIQLWHKNNLSALSQRGKAPDITQFEPNLSPDGTTVSFVEGAVLQNQDMAGQSMYDWWNSLQIVTTNLQSGAEKLLSTAGHGVSSPHYGPDGEHMIFLKGSQLDVTAADNTGRLTSVFQVNSTTQSYGGQWGFTVPLDITDYVR